MSIPENGDNMIAHGTRVTVHGKTGVIVTSRDTHGHVEYMIAFDGTPHVLMWIHANVVFVIK